MAEAPEGALWPEDMAQRFGLRDARAATWAASQTRRRREEHEADQRLPGPKQEGKPAVTAMDFPEPDGRAKRTITTSGGHTRVATSPYWLPATAERYEENKRGPGRRPNPKPEETEEAAQAS